MSIKRHLGERVGLSEMLMPCLFSIDGDDLSSSHSSNAGEIYILLHLPCHLSKSHVLMFTQLNRKASTFHDSEISMGSGKNSS